MTVQLENGKITASKEMLNELSLALLHASRWQEKRGYKGSAKYYNKDSETIYNALSEAGFYNN